MDSIFRMSEVNPLFLIRAQRPLSGTIITGVQKMNHYYYVSINTTNVQTIKSFIKSLEDIGTLDKLDFDTPSWHFKPKRL